MHLTYCVACDILHLRKSTPLEANVDWKLFWLTLAVGVLFVIVQGIAAWSDGYLTQTQMRSHGVTNGWSFFEHGGMWADVFVISPIVAYSVSNYKLDYFSKGGLTLFAIALVVSLAMGYMYQRGGITTREAHTHDGITPLAGWIHGIYAVAAIWVSAMVFLNFTTPSVSRVDIIVISILLTPFFYLGIVKFSERWVFSPAVQWQVAIEIIGLWALAGIRIWNA